MFVRVICGRTMRQWSKYISPLTTDWCNRLVASWDMRLCGRYHTACTYNLKWRHFKYGDGIVWSPQECGITEMSSQGFGCSPIKKLRELGLDRSDSEWDLEIVWALCQNNFQSLNSLNPAERYIELFVYEIKKKKEPITSRRSRAKTFWKKFLLGNKLTISVNSIFTK